MDGASEQPYRVQVDGTATPEQVQAVKDLLDELELPGEVEEGFIPEGAGGPGELPMFIQLVCGFGLVHFFQGFLSKAGSDAYDGLARLVGGLRARLRKPQSITINDPEADVMIYLSDEMTPEEIRLLEDIDLQNLRSCTLELDRDSQTWFRTDQPEWEWEQPPDDH
jgi:hypothetical protein